MQKKAQVFWYHFSDEADLMPEDRCIVSCPDKVFKTRLLLILEPVIKNHMVHVHHEHDLSTLWTMIIPKMASEMVTYTLSVTAAYLASLTDKQIRSASVQDLLKGTEHSIQGRKRSWFCRHDDRIDFDSRFSGFLIQRTKYSLESPPTP